MFMAEAGFQKTHCNRISDIAYNLVFNLILPWMDCHCNNLVHYFIDAD